jgi:hypothetical protein
MAVEGNNVVVVWQGYQEGYGEFPPSDIYFITSRDGGRTWSRVARVTDNARQGIITGRPQVALYHNVIHLFCIQGKLNFKQEMPGLIKLNQPPWPIYYTQRPFPN